MTSHQSLRQQLSGSEPALKLLRAGKVRQVYDLNDRLLIVSTDRISAFDYILPTPIPGKGAILNQLSAFWFSKTKTIIANHAITSDINEIRKAVPQAKLDSWYDGRTMLVKKAKRVDFECVVRGYLAGSGWNDYKASGAVCGIALPAGLNEAQKLPEPLFTPTTKADSGHDENISFEKLEELAGRKTAAALRAASMALYKFGAGFLSARGIILADTKFEFGFDDAGGLIVIDEMLTPDSSRFWDAKTYRTGVSPESFDKQFVRDYLTASGWNKNSAPPELPSAVVEGTLNRYRQALKAITL